MKPNQISKLFLLTGAMFLLPFLGVCQKWVADTITIRFGSKEKIDNCAFNLLKVNDLRNTFPEFVSVFQQKKWLFFPVDQIVKTEKPLAVNLNNKFQSDTFNSGNYTASIYQFNIKNATSSGKRHLKLFSTVELSEITPTNDTILVGSFYYECSFSQKKKEKIGGGYEKLIDNWITQFAGDIQLVQNGLDQINADKLYYFRRGAKAIKKNLYSSVDLFAGLNFWGIDGELWFSDPEGSRIFNRSAGIIRYLNYPNVQSIALGSNVRRWNYRVSDYWLFTHKMAFLLGVNNWKDMKTAAHKFEEIFVLDASMTQQLNYNLLDKKGFVFGLGLMEDAHYIIYHNLKLNVGLSLNCAYKF